MPAWRTSLLRAAAVGVLVVVATRGAAAQQFCYAYDDLGQLVAVIDPQGHTAIYDYDPVGNILDVRRNDATTPVAITFVNPPEAVAGTPIDILGLGFSDTPSQDQVTINGVAAQVLSASSCRMTVVVPAGAAAGSGTITVTTPMGSASTSLGFTVDVGVSVVPPRAAAVINEPIAFTATVTGLADQRVTWAASGVAGGNATVGMVDATGLYTAPAAVPTPSQVRVRATSVSVPSAFGEATVDVVAKGNEADSQTISVLNGTPPPRGGVGLLEADAPTVAILNGTAPPAQPTALEADSLAVSVRNGP